MLTKLKALAAKIRTAEPAWLATKRKAIAGGATTLATGWLARRLGHDLSMLDVEAIAAAVGGVVTWAIPNKTTIPNQEH